MAARSPTAYDFSYDDKGIGHGELITNVIPKAVIDNQDYLLRAERQMISEPIKPLSGILSASLGELYRTLVYGKNKCGAAFGDSLMDKVYVKAWADTATNFDIQISDGTNTDTLTVSASQTSKIWRSVTIANATWPYSDTIGEIRILMGNYADGGANKYFLGGVFLSKDD